MKKDIFIDSNIATIFPKPPTQAYKDLIEWLLLDNPEDPDDRAFLLISDQLRTEYFRCSNNSSHEFAICNILRNLTKTGQIKSKIESRNSRI